MRTGIPTAETGIDLKQFRAVISQYGIYIRRTQQFHAFKQFLAKLDQRGISRTDGLVGFAGAHGQLLFTVNADGLKVLIAEKIITIFGAYKDLLDHWLCRCLKGGLQLEFIMTNGNIN